MMQFNGQQTEQGYESGEESIKIERNSRGYNWSFRLKRQEGQDFDSWVDSCAALDNRLRARFGGQSA